MKTYEVISFGSAVIDAFIDTGVSEKEGMLCFPSGTKIQVKDLSFAIGGGGVNSSVCLSRLGIKAGYLGKVGKGNNADRIINELKQNKVDFLGVKSDERTGYSAILESNEKNRVILTFKGASDYLKFSEIKLGKLKTKWFYFTSMREESFKTQIKLIDYALKNKIKIIFNPSSYQTKLGADYLKPILKNTEILSLNMEEARMLTKEDNLPKGLRELGPNIVLITNGENPGFVNDGKILYKYWPNKVIVADPTGAGDVFASSFVAGIIKTKDIETAVRVAMTNSESLIQKKGAHNGLLNWKEIDKKIKNKEHKVERVSNSR